MAGRSPLHPPPNPLSRPADSVGTTTTRSTSPAATGVYNDALHHAILLLKYQEVTRLGDKFAARLAELVAHEREEFGADVVVPVPLQPERQREPGYNQAELIARPLVRLLHLKQGAYLLVRTKPRPARLVLSRKEHRDSVRGGYATRKGLRVDKLRALLIDDVMTAGATLDSCARALNSAEASSVLGLTVARVVPEWSPSADRNRGKQSQGGQTNRVRRASLPAPKERIKRRKGGAHG